MEFRVLGPLEVRRDGKPVAVPGGKPRAVLAVLLLQANEPVSADRLAVALWGEDAPAGTARTVQVYVSRLRRALGEDDRLASSRAGYRLLVGPGELDLERFERLAEEGRRALAAGRPHQAGALLREALGLWSGPPLADLAFAPFAQTEIARLEEQGLAAVEARVETDLAAGRHGELIGELQRLVSEHPLRERLHGQLMLALYRSGRQADALTAYGRARGVLVEQLGLEPGSELRALQRAILAQDADVAAPSATRGRDVEGVGPGPLRFTASGERRLPVPPNRTVGREREVRALAERLRRQSVRLVTVTGPGGVGKTRLAMQCARAVEADFADGARFVPLAAAGRPEEVPAALVATLGVSVLSGESAAEAVERFLAAKHLLLVLDNCEHVLGAAPLIGTLLARCPGITVLATSREPLRLSVEERVPVPPLALPQHGAAEDPTTLAAVDAVALFSERARAHDPGFELGDGNAAAVAELCRRLDGLPLAIELAAARVDLLSPTEIADRVARSLAVLVGGPRDAPARQQSLRATLDWSYDLLGDCEKACFARFAVFAGGATVAAAEAIADADLATLNRLVATSLLVRHQEAHMPTRLGMLETIRTYAGERFSTAADRDAVADRHYRFYLAHAQGHGSDRALCGRAGEHHFAQLDGEIANLHAALQWTVDNSDGGSAISMVAALGRFWLMRDRYADAINWTAEALSLPGADRHPAPKVRALCTEAMALWALGRKDDIAPIVAEAESAARALDDPVLLSQVLQIRARHARHTADTKAAETFAQEALRRAQTAGDEWQIASTAYEHTLGASNITELRARVDRAVALLDEVGNMYELAALLVTSAHGALAMGGDRDAKELAERAIPIAREHATPFLWTLLCGNLGLASLITGDTGRATQAFREELKLCHQLVVRPLAFEALQGLAAIAAAQGDHGRAARLSGAASAHRYGEPEDAVEARVNAAFLEPARIRSGTHAWDAAARQGAALSLEDAIADALRETPVSGEALHHDHND